MSKKEKHDTRSHVDYIMRNRKPLTKSGCHDYFETGGEDMLLGYKDGVYDSTNALQKMLKSANNFEELKTDLQKFVSKQKELLIYMSDTWTGGTMEEYWKNLDEIRASNQDPSTSLEASKPSSP